MQNAELDPNKEGKPSVEEKKANLKMQCDSIPFAAWIKYSTLFKMHPPVGMLLESPLLPAQGSHHSYREGIDLPEKYVTNHDTIELVLARNGKILEKLTHLSSDGDDSETSFPDEFLGETSDDGYHRGYRFALTHLKGMKEVAEKMFPSANRST